MFGPLAFILWVVFAVLWIFEPSALTSIWDWIQGLPLVLEIIVWIVFLPWVFGLWIWQTSLDLWLRILIIVVLALVTGGTASNRSWSKARARKRAQQ